MAGLLLLRCFQSAKLIKLRRKTGILISIYIVDFYCPECRLAIELDGQGHFEVNVDAYEAERTKYLESRGLRILRFENKIVFENLEAVLDTIKTVITNELFVRD